MDNMYTKKSLICEFMFAVPLNFAEKTESPPSDLSPCYTLYGQPIIFNGSANFTFSCHFTGYPPVQSITWDLGHFNDYDCITYSEDNQVRVMIYASHKKGVIYKQ